ncbi:MAG: DUF188 domain-containing protein [Clostridiales bacterium]|jgi:uncharacterized protein YaiI (UPF0178 family)|nr:DUF188 domain-containing protein [Clostridiales bacterium]
MTIYIDADGCPVVDQAIRVAGRYNVRCVIICDTAHIYNRSGVTTITVSKGPDSVDFALTQRLKPGDVVITQDYGLAAMCLAMRTTPISQNGMIYDDRNIDALLFQRHLSKQARKAGERLRGSVKRVRCQDQSFEQTLSKVLAEKVAQT